MFNHITEIVITGTGLTSISKFSTNQYKIWVIFTLVIYIYHDGCPLISITFQIFMNIKIKVSSLDRKFVELLEYKF